MTVTRTVTLKVTPVLLEPVGGGMCASVICHQCGTSDEWRLSRIPPPDILKKHFIIRGWQLRKKPVCPACQAQKKERPAMPAVSPQPAASDAMKKARRLIYMALEDYYDEAARRYREGHSDESIAKETGASLAVVRSIREADFGPLGPPSEFAALQAEVESLRARLTEICTRNGWPVSSGKEG